MTNEAVSLTPTDLIAAASSVMRMSGYQEVSSDWSTPSTRLFEDEYCVVGLAVFTTCAELIGSWTDLQGSLVEIISNKVGLIESKTWDGYLVLLTPGIAPSGDSNIEEIRYNTARLRKFIATGEDLKGAGDVEQLLRPLLPLHMKQYATSEGSALDLLPDLLDKHGINRDTTAIIVKAFTDQEPLIEQLHQSRGFR